MAGSVVGSFIVLRNPRGGWRVVNHDGKERTRRHKLRHAQDVAYRLNTGQKIPRESVQVLCDWPRLFLKRKPQAVLSFVLADKNGVVIKRFAEEWRARWWLNRYNDRRDLRESLRPRKDGEKVLLDWIRKRWLVSDDGINLSERVLEIENLLRAGLA